MLLGRKGLDADYFRQEIGVPGIEIITGTSLDDARDALAEHSVDHVVMGAGLGLHVRLDIIRTVFEASDTTTVHMKDTASGPAGMPAFTKGVVGGLRDYSPRHS